MRGVDQRGTWKGMWNGQRKEITVHSFTSKEKVYCTEQCIQEIGYKVYYETRACKIISTTKHLLVNLFPHWPFWLLGSSSRSSLQDHKKTAERVAADNIPTDLLCLFRECSKMEGGSYWVSCADALTSPSVQHYCDGIRVDVGFFSQEIAFSPLA